MVRGQPRYEVKVVHAEGSRGVGHRRGQGTGHARGAASGGTRPFRDSSAWTKANLTPSAANLFISSPASVPISGRPGDGWVAPCSRHQEIDGVETRVVEEREEKNGKLAEVSPELLRHRHRPQGRLLTSARKWILQERPSRGSRGGLAFGRGRARFGLIMPVNQSGRPLLSGDRPSSGMDRAELISLAATNEDTAGTFDKCLHVTETSPLESGTSASGTWPHGLVRDDELLLTKVEDPKKKSDRRTTTERTQWLSVCLAILGSGCSQGIDLGRSGTQAAENIKSLSPRRRW